MTIHKTRSRASAGLTGLLLAFLSIPVSATEPGWYGGFSVGQSEIKDTGSLNELCSTVFVVCDDANNDTALQGIIGYQINDFVAAEGMYFDLGSPSLTVSAIPASSISSMASCCS